MSRALIAAVIVVILLFFFGKLTTDDRCTATETTLARARAKHVTEVNDITCNYDRLISGRGRPRSCTRSSEQKLL